jgi:hypothetical protein
LVPLSGPRRQNCPSTKKPPPRMHRRRKKGLFSHSSQSSFPPSLAIPNSLAWPTNKKEGPEILSVMMPLEPLFPVAVDKIVVVLVQLIPSSLYGCIYPRDLSARRMLQSCRMGKISAIEVPNWIPPLSIPSYKTFGAGRWRFLHPSPVGGGEPSPQAFRGIACLLRYYALFLSSGGKTSLIIVTIVCS